MLSLVASTFLFTKLKYGDERERASNSYCARS